METLTLWEKFKIFLKTYFNEILFSVFFIVALSTMALPYSNLEIGEDSGVIYFMDVISNGSFTYNGANYALTNTFALLLVGLILLIGSEVVLIVSSFFKNKKVKVILNSVTLTLLLASLFINLLGGFLIGALDLSAIEASGTLDNTFGIVFTILVILMALISFSNIFDLKKYSIQEICETSILIALAVVLDQFVKIPIQANGGSISFSALPLFIIAIRYGSFKSFVASSFIFGFLTCLLDGYGFQTFPFDYLVALSGYGLVGTAYNFAKRFYVNIEDKSKQRKMQFVYSSIAIIIAAIPVMFVRYAGHMISACILYGYDFINDFAANFLYQSTYVPGAVGCSIAGMILLLEPVIMINRVFPIKTVKESKY